MDRASLTAGLEVARARFGSIDVLEYSPAPHSPVPGFTRATPSESDVDNLQPQPAFYRISAANTHDSQGLERLVRGIPPIRSRRGPRRRRPAKLHADNGTVGTSAGRAARSRRTVRRPGVR